MSKPNKKKSEFFDNLFIVGLAAVVILGWCSMGPSSMKPQTDGATPSASASAADSASVAPTAEVPPELQPVKDEHVLSEEPVLDGDLLRGGDALYDDEHVKGMGDGDCAQEGGSCEKDVDCCDAYCTCYHGTCQLDSPKH